MAASVVLVYGEDDYRVSRKAEMVLRDQGAWDDPMQRDTIDADAELSDAALQALGRCIEALRSMGLFTAEKTVWLKGATFLGVAGARMRTDAVKARIADLAAMIKQGMPPGQRLLITATGMDKRSILFKACQAAGEIHDCSVPAKAHLAEQAAERFARECLDRAGVALSRDGLAALVERVGTDSRSLVSEVEKLAAYVGARKRATRDDVLAIVSPARDTPGWDFADAVGRRDTAEAVRVLRQLIYQGEKPMGLLFALESRLADLRLFREAMARNWLSRNGPNAQWQSLPPDEAAVFDAMADSRQDPRRNHPFRAGILAGQAANYTEAELDTARRAAVEAHETLVTSGLPEAWVLELLAIRITRRDGDDGAGS